MFFVTIYVGAGLIANDRRANALQLYLSKPMTSAEYIAGKLAILFLFLVSVTFLPAMMLLLTQAMFAGSLTFVRNNLYLLPAITLVLAGAGAAGLDDHAGAVVDVEEQPLRGGDVCRAVLLHDRRCSTRCAASPAAATFAWLSPTAALEQLGDVIFRLPPRYQLSPAIAGLTVLVLIAGSICDPDAPRARRGDRDVIDDNDCRERLSASSAHSCREPTPSGLVLVQTDGVSKWYGQVSGLNNVTVSIPPGITGLLGPNGAGKSTFMKLMTGQLKPSQGTIRVLGEPIWGNPRVYDRIGFCPEQDAFYERMTGLEWVTALVRLNGLQRRRCRRRREARARSRRPDGRRPARRSAPTARACGSASSWRRRSSTIPSC